MITSAPEALGLHHNTVQDMWGRALRGGEAAEFMKALISRQSE